MAKQAAKQAAKRLAKAALRAGARLLAQGAAYLIGMIGWPVAVIATAALLICLLLAAFYGAMPATSALTGTYASQYDKVIRQDASNDVAAANVEETWLVSGESDSKNSWYPGEGSQNFGKLMDEYGQDVRLENQWGDVYAPVLYHAAQASQESSENTMQDQAWVDAQLGAAADGLKPWFYYKKSHITTTTVGSDGKSTTSTATVYLLVEAYTIRGHWQYHYQWTTRSLPNGGSETYEKLSSSQELSDGMDYLKKYLLTAYQIPDDDNANLAAMATYKMAQGFTSDQENFEALEADPHSVVSIGGRIFTDPQELKYQPVNANVIIAYLQQFDSALANAADVNIIIAAAQAHGINPLLMFAIAGQEQIFDDEQMDNQTDVYLISQNPFNVGGSWQWTDFTLAQSADICANFLAERLSQAPPPGTNAVEWINDPNNNDGGLYASEPDGSPTPGWWEGVTASFRS